ncbi:MAG: hypothetical protein HY606_02710, partial [Planctomycetes bacterium]|nr:hypothetical protein [Planctomycetota bacterium]
HERNKDNIVTSDSIKHEKEVVSEKAAESEKSIDNSQNTEKEISSGGERRTVCVRGSVVDGDGKPADLVRVHAQIFSEDETKLINSLSSITDEKGLFEITAEYSSPPAAKYKLYIYLKGTERFITKYKNDGTDDIVMSYRNPCYASIQSFELNAKEQLVEASFHCNKTASLKVKVFPTPDIKEYAFLHMSVKEDSFNKFTYVVSGYKEASVIAYENGSNYRYVPGEIVIVCPADIRIKLLCERHGFVNKTVQVDPLSVGEERTVEMSMEEAGFELKGQCLDENGAPLKGVWVSCSQEDVNNLSVVSGDDGYFAMKGLVNKPVKQLQFHHKFYSKTLENVEITDSLKVVLTRVAESVRFTGACVDKNGNPLANIHITISQGSYLTENSSTDQGGSFSFELIADKPITSIIFHTRYLPGQAFPPKSKSFENVDKSKHFLVTLE